MKKWLWLLALVCMHSIALSQVRIDGDFPFQTDPAKKYSLYIPSGYQEGEPHKMMVGLHPLNTSRWDGESWCDTLTTFAETNNLLLVCPDGGADGRIDDAIDTAFTSALMDSVALWYTINSDKTYLMGFSWGGRATYTYGLNHHNDFGGFIPIGAAISGTGLFNNVLDNAEDKPFYLVHGSNDTPNQRFYPARDSLIAHNAVVDWLLMPGVGHTIDFPNRNAILGDAFQFIDSVNCVVPTSIDDFEDGIGGGSGDGFEDGPAGGFGDAGRLEPPFDLFPNPVSLGGVFELRREVDTPVQVEIYDASGKQLRSERMSGQLLEVDTARLARGTYLVRLDGVGGGTRKLIVQ